MPMINVNPNEYASFYEDYVNLATAHFTSLVLGLEEQLNTVKLYFDGFPTNKEEFRYEVGKWTPKDIVQHLIDAERIFAYRSLRIARNDKTPLPGFDENSYVDMVEANKRSLASLVGEFIIVRKATITLFQNFSEEQLQRFGTASNASVSVRALGCIILGHTLHHLNVITTRYLDIK
ncbi:DinB family protein [Flavobacterium chuncheonense]|uniref:DinB family protein n=1 Tax=Flavobacterium chuncheonense TaxID=2026653 RepID=A0ABW5YJC9_9FLAO